MKVAIISISDPMNRRSWSGTTFTISQEIIRQLGEKKVILIGPISSFGINQILRLLSYFLYKFTKRKYNYSHSIILSFIYSKVVDYKIRSHKEVDILFFIGSSNAISFLKNDRKIPIIHLTDATFNSLNGYYLKNLFRISIDESNFVESLALSKCSQIIYSSKWALSEAVDFYKLKATNSIIKFGSNLDDRPFKERKFVSGQIFNLLFVGVDWVRKGGDIVYHTFKELKSRGYKISLTIVGCVPPMPILKDMEVIPFLDKNDSTGMSDLLDLYSKSHILFLPTRAECSAIVYAEAAQFGLPVISTKTGGVSSYVEHNLNGFLLGIDDSYPSYCEKIIQLMEDHKLYRQLSLASYTKYQNELNWKNSIEKIINSFHFQKNQIENAL
jgi:glycosyltransferase involved in cell wall biosynthesis